MSQENVEKLRKEWDIWMTGNLADLSLLDADVILEETVLPEQTDEPYHGHEGVRRAWARWSELWETLDTELEWARDAGDSVVSCHRVHVRGRGSGIETETRYAYVWTFRKGKITHYKSYRDPTEALKAAGLEE